MRAGQERERPREAPAVAMEHRQRPEIDGAFAHAAGEDVGVAHQRRAAVMAHDAFGIAGGARRVIERDRVPFVARHRPREMRIAAGHEVFVVDCAFERAALRKLGIVIDHEQRLGLRERERGLRGLGEFEIDDEDFRLGMIEHEGDRCRIEPRVERVQHAARHGYAMMGFEHRRCVGEQDRDGVAAADPLVRQRRGQPARPRVELGIGDAALAVDDGDDIGMRGRGARKKAQRRQRLEIGGRPVEVSVVGRDHPLGGCRASRRQARLRRDRPAAQPAADRRQRLGGAKRPLGGFQRGRLARCGGVLALRLHASCEGLWPWPFSRPCGASSARLWSFRCEIFDAPCFKSTVEKAARNLEHVHRRWKAERS